MKNTPKDPNMTLELKNDAIEEMLEIYRKEPTVENLNKLVGMVHKSRVIVPSNKGKDGKPVPFFIQNQQGDVFLPVFTSRQNFDPNIVTPFLMNIPFLGANATALKGGVDCAGIVINPSTHNLVFKRELLQKIEEVEKKQTEGVSVKTNMTEAEYMQFERRQFGVAGLPKFLFAGQGEVIEGLCSRKEECMDELFEAAYQNKRMYPYLPEEFSVMPMDISEQQLMIRLDFPNRDITAGACERAYMVGDKANEKARYFTIERAAKGHVLGEVTADGKHIHYGDAPVEGAELAKIQEMV